MCLLSEYISEMEPYPARDSAMNALRMKYGSFHEMDDSTRAALSDERFNINASFPRKTATVSQFVDHVDHIVELVGIDHVGFGSDFDGGAGIEGCNDVSELQNITAEMLSRGYNIYDLEKFWSGNILRVMKRVEKTAKRKRSASADTPLTNQ